MSEECKIELGPPHLTKFERAVIVGVRALQLSIGAPPLIDISKLPKRDALIIAREELRRGLLPITVKRRTQSGKEVLVPLDCLLKKEKEVFGEVPKLM
ncbi:DNA-directed RNA polymerase subunit K [Ignicoccus hospitalis]|uniref:DNA-directed RNA polymerase subunit Rpo6 n=1 Tax=Ignicoccus hospitalis (strain KIN4/I / DSM 18386 / JCM 14125) TaxID=453591 RepID=A8A8T3_IGNH4|nr:DNA-directed RNA polymerase subunit K [Ignicoccus hospitalis]ABU81335.1 DNA-directed RNA polymerase, subunit K [Ignicoccus hospitalis KIN4/I]